MGRRDARRNKDVDTPRVGRPRLPPEGRRKLVAVSISPEAYGMLDELKLMDYANRSAVVDRLIREAYSRQKHALKVAKQKRASVAPKKRKTAFRDEEE